MQSPPPRSRNPAVVPFSWEEKPGVPKKQESGTLLLSLCIPPPLPLLHQQTPSPSPALSIPPCLQRPSLRKTNSFASIRSSPPPHASSAGVLVRRQSFDSRLLYQAGAGGSDPRRRSKPGTHTIFSHGSLTEQIPHEKRRLRQWMEEDPFFMAIEVCRQEPAEASCNRKRRPDAGRVKQWKITGLEHLTMRQLFTQQLQEDDCLHSRGTQKQPLIVQKKQSGGLYKFLAKCLAC